MSTFEVPVVRISAIVPIDGADRIEAAIIGDYQSVIRKGQYQVGDLVIYIPEQAIVPDNLLKEMGLDGKLSGSGKNRVKACRLKSILSQGIVYNKAPDDAVEGEDFAERLNIVKWEPTVPQHMAGDVANLAFLYGKPVHYDIENIKKFNRIIEDGEPVSFTEKGHGSFCGLAVDTSVYHEEIFDGDGFVYSKGLGAKGLVFKNNEANDNNLYVSVARELDIFTKIRALMEGSNNLPGCKNVPPIISIHILGEIYGAGVQDLTYGGIKRKFAAFDVVVDGEYLSVDSAKIVVKVLGLDYMPELYRGPFSKEVLEQYTNGSTVLGNGAHIREGIVVRPLIERKVARGLPGNRVILKSVSEAYLLRKEGTEYQ